MALYTKQELQKERSNGLILSDYDNETEFGELDGNYFEEWTNEQFESYLLTKQWDDSIKNVHRKQFKGRIKITGTSISYN